MIVPMSRTEPPAVEPTSNKQNKQNAPKEHTIKIAQNTETNAKNATQAKNTPAVNENKVSNCYLNKFNITGESKRFPIKNL